MIFRKLLPTEGRTFALRSSCFYANCLRNATRMKPKYAIFAAPPKQITSKQLCSEIAAKLHVAYTADDCHDGSNNIIDTCDFACVQSGRIWYLSMSNKQVSSMLSP
jgi:hypothetical protein